MPGKRVAAYEAAGPTVVTRVAWLEDRFARVSREAYAGNAV